MDVYKDFSRAYVEPRAHPWAFGGDNQEFRYYDFKQFPELIPTVLEDFRPYRERPAVQTFFEFLRWANSPESELETDDCLFRPPKPHKDNNSDKKLGCHGRIFVFFRHLEFNLVPSACDWFHDVWGVGVSGIDSEFTPSQGVVGLTKQRAWYTALPHREQHEILGGSLMLSFWAYGDTDDEAYDNLQRLVSNLHEVARQITLHVREHREKFENAVAEQRKSDQPSRFVMEWLEARSASKSGNSSGSGSL
jgi:hypothetical protein